MKIVKILLMLMFCFLAIDTPIVSAYVDSNNDYIIFLRAGGGSGSSNSGSSGSSSYPFHSSYGRNVYLDKRCLIREVFFWTCIFILFSSSTIILYFKVFKASIHNRKYLNLLSKKDMAWDYKKN